MDLVGPVDPGQDCAHFHGGFGNWTCPIQSSLVIYFGKETGREKITHLISLHFFDLDHWQCLECCEALGQQHPFFDASVMSEQAFIEQRKHEKSQALTIRCRKCVPV